MSTLFPGLAISSASCSRNGLATLAEGLILDCPTVGVDVGARDEIYKIVGRLAGNGASPL